MTYCEHTFRKDKENPRRELVFFIEEEVQSNLDNVTLVNRTP